MSKVVCITGITGQCGSYLAEQELAKGNKVYGVVRRSSTFTTERIDHLYTDPHVSKRLELVYGDVTDYASMVKIIGDIKPDYLYNMAAMSHVAVSFENPLYTAQATGVSALNVLEAIKQTSPKTAVLQASSSEMFGLAPAPQSETTPFQPASPYSCAKAFGYYCTINYRDMGLQAYNAITFNMESPRRGLTFLPRKVSRAASRIKMGLQDKLYVGNLKAKRSWQHCKEACAAMSLIIESGDPDDYVISAPHMHSVQELIELVFGKLDLDWKQHVEIDTRYLRAVEVPELLGDTTKIKNKLGWESKITFEMLMDDMVESDMKLAKQELLLKEQDL